MEDARWEEECNLHLRKIEPSSNKVTRNYTPAHDQDHPRPHPSRSLPLIHSSSFWERRGFAKRKKRNLWRRRSDIYRIRCIPCAIICKRIALERFCLRRGKFNFVSVEVKQKFTPGCLPIRTVAQLRKTRRKSFRNKGKKSLAGYFERREKCV